MFLKAASVKVHCICEIHIWKKKFFNYHFNLISCVHLLICEKMKKKLKTLEKKCRNMIYAVYCI